MTIRIKPLAAILPLLFTPLLHAQQLALLDPVMVTATRTETRTDALLSDVTVVTRDEILSAPATALPELLATLPGIQYVSNGGRGASGSLFLRGSNSEHSLILIDGQRLSSATLGTTAIEHIPLDLIERIEIVRGPASSLYGADAIGGVIQIFTRRGNGTPAPRFALEYGRYNTQIAQAGYGGQMGDTRFDLQAGIENSSGFSTYRNATGGFFDPFNADDDRYRNVNFSGQISQRLSSTLEIGAQALHINATKRFDGSNCDSFFITCTAAYDNRLQQEMTAYSTYLRFKPAERWSSRLQIGQSQDKVRSWRLDPSVPAEAVDRFVTVQDQLSWQNDFALGPYGTLLAAYDWRNERVGSTQPFTVHSRTNNAVVLGYQGAVGAHALQASARRDDTSGFDPHYSGNLAYGYEILNGLRARAALGTAYHVPTFNHLYWPADPINFYQGNPNLRPEKSFNREIGLTYERGTVQASATAYYNRVRDLLNYVPSFSFPFLGQYENIGRATLKGLSLSYAQQLGNWTVKGGYDYLNATDDTTGKDLQRRVPRSGNLSLSYRQGDWTTGVQLQAYSGHFNDTANTQWLGGYTLTNLFASYRVHDGWSVFARANNIFDRNYVAVRDAFNGNDYSVPGASLFVGIRYEPR